MGVQTYIDSRHFWFPLDNAAKIYPAVQSGEHTTVFRISAILREKIHITSLQRALANTERRFPYFRVRLCKGLFWYYLEYADQSMVPVPDNGVCKAFEGASEDKLLLRIPVRNNKVSVEFS